MNIFIQQVINFLQLGSIYALCALSFSMVYGVAHLVNFAHGSIFGVSMYVLFFASTFLFTKIESAWMVHVPESRRIFPDLTVGENLRIAAYLYEKTNRELFHERLEKVWTLFPNLKTRINQLGGTLSGGEQQMLAIGRALITGGDMLLLDEPSMGLAPMLVKEILGTVKRIAEEGQTILLVEQNAMMAMDIATYCYVLETGNIVYEGTSEYIKSNEKIVKAYLG